ncbi:MAG: prepilin peptidase [Chloroflexi bacterium]|nr:prepilin peptidase [Chloroflexota bacterium]
MTTAYFGFLAVLLGASVGSFLNVVADRIPSGRSLVSPGSYCESCNTTLGAVELFPVLSYLWLRGKCRHCAARIPGRLAVVEAATGVLFLLLFLRFGPTAEFAVFAAATALLVAITLIDLEHGLILDKMVFPTVALLLVLAPFWEYLGDDRTFFSSGGVIGSFANSVSAGAMYFFLLFLVVILYPKGMGGGDVKLAALLGLLIGFPAVLVAFWVTVVVGGVVAVYLLLARRRGRKDEIPYGPYMAVGAFVAILVGSEIWNWYSEFALGFGGAS